MSHTIPMVAFTVLSTTETTLSPFSVAITEYIFIYIYIFFFLNSLLNACFESYAIQHQSANSW
jgi:hypothetical protein